MFHNLLHNKPKEETLKKDKEKEKEGHGHATTATANAPQASAVAPTGSKRVVGFTGALTNINII